MAFEAHGEIDVKAEYPLLITGVNGPWNQELVDLWAAEVRPHAESFSGRGPWVGIGVIHRSTLCTADSLERYREVARLLVARHRAVGAAHVVSSDVEGALLMREVFADVFRDVLPFEQIESLPAAREWALSLLRTRSASQ